jgi:hypothetical protein
MIGWPSLFYFATPYNPVIICPSLKVTCPFYLLIKMNQGFSIASTTFVLYWVLDFSTIT